MSDYAKDKIISLAISQIGYKEEGTNITKYAAYIDKYYPKFYNTRKQGTEWCDIFYDYLFLYTFGEDPTLKMIYQPLHSAGAGCKYSANYYRSANAFYSSPKKGDQIFFGKKGSETHTGIVIDYSSSIVTTIEGNKSNMVKQCSYKITDSNIAGYGRPKWDVIPEPEPVPVPEPEPEPIGRIFETKLQELHFGDEGILVRTVQRILKDLLYNGADGKPIRVNGVFDKNMDYAVTGFQKNAGLPITKVVDEATWNYLIKGKDGLPK